MPRRQNLTLSLTPETTRKAKILAAHRNTSVTRLLAGMVEQLVQEDERYEAARRTPLAYLDEGLPLGGDAPGSRGKWQER